MRATSEVIRELGEERTVRDEEIFLKVWPRLRLGPIGQWIMVWPVQGDVRRAQGFALR